MSLITGYPGLEDYAPLIDDGRLERIARKAERLRGLRVININSTFYGGGVAEILSSLTLLARSVGIREQWQLIQGSPDFFSVTKKLHNALQGASIDLTERKRAIYEQLNYENAVRMELDADLVMVHDPQPLPLITHFRKTCPWIWRCHVDLTRPNPEAWAYLKPFVEEYDAVILSLPEYAQALALPQFFFMPAIDPFSLKNRELSNAEIDDRLDHYGIPRDRPIVTQISRFDRWKDPQGVIRAVELARREVDCTLVLLGNVATDDPEGQEVFESLLECRGPHTIILSVQDTVLVNALQRRAAVVLQKSLREGFGLTVTEAMWKRAAVIGGNVGGIRHQITDGVDGFLVDTVEQAAERIVRLIRNPELRRRIGDAARERVRRDFLLPRLLEQRIDLIASFEPQFRLNPRHLDGLTSTDAVRLPPLPPG